MREKTLRTLEYNKILEMLEEFAVSLPGKTKAKELKPSSAFMEVKKCLDETSEAESILRKKGRGIINKFEDILPIIKRVRIGGILSSEELMRISKLLSATRNAQKNINGEDYKELYPIIMNLAQGLRPVVSLNDEIKKCIDEDLNISDYASSQLLTIRRKINSCNNRIRDKLNSIVHSPSYSKYLQEPIVTERNGRYVVPVKQEYRTNVKGMIHDQSSSGATLFIEPMSVVELNNDLKRLSLEEQREIDKILAELSNRVLENAESILISLNIMTKLDFIFAKGRLSISMNAVTPELVDKRVIKVVSGRHPLIQPDEVVPITVELGDAFSTLVITGPNTGGKTVTLKTLGLFVLMTQAGLNIPCNFGTSMGVFSDVFADIGDEQSIEQSLSTFSSHMKNIVDIIRRVDSNALLLFDELGAGTDPVEGAALAMSILKWATERNITTAATTHYSELKVFAMQQDKMQNASMEFDVETLRPTYRLMIGIPGRSNAFEICLKLGLDNAIVDGAKQFVSQENIKFEDILSNIEKDRIMTRQAKADIDKRLFEIENLKSKLNNELEIQNKKRTDILNEARVSARRMVREAKDEADRIVKELRDISKRGHYNAEAEKHRSLLKNKANELDQDIKKSQNTKKQTSKPKLKKVKVGERVYIESLDKDGDVLTKPDNNGDLTVQVGIMKVTVNIKDLRVTKNNKKQTSVVYKNVNLKDRAVKTEIDLRGRNAEEAIAEIDKFIDNAFLTGIKEVTIIHGKGTGILRRAVHDYLKSSSHIDAYRLGKYGEGEEGVTIVNLK